MSVPPTAVDPAELGPAVLFCPASRPDRYGKAAAAADTVILDLEDAVAPADKPAARIALAEHPLDPDRTLVRVNQVDGPHFPEDLAALRRTGYHTVMLAKAESAEQVAALEGFRVVALCESPLGIEQAGQVAAAESVIALMWGGEDLIAALGGTSSRDAEGRYRDVVRYARSRVLMAAVAHGKLAWDAVHLDIRDLAGQRAEARDAAASGFSATVCIHPGQVPVVRDAYRPDEAELAWAREVLAEADRLQVGVFNFRGRMIDEPVLRQARRALRAAG